MYSKGIKVLTYINPLITDITSRGTPYRHNYYQEGIDNNYFIKQGDGSVWIGYSNASIVDLTDPQAYQWIMNMIVEVSTTKGSLPILDRVHMVFFTEHDCY